MTSWEQREPRVLDHLERVHPDQKMSNAWRWGPHWEADGQEGIWVVSRFDVGHPTAIRLVFDESRPLLEWKHFNGRLEDLKAGALDVDDRLRAIDTPKPVRKRRQPVPRVMAADLEALNAFARSELK